MMNKTQRLIVLIGDQNITEEALKIIRGFKAITVIKKLSQDILENVYRHNKNAVYVTSNISMEMIRTFRPIIIKCIPGISQIESLKMGEDVLNDFPRILDTLNIDVGDHMMFDSSDSGEVKHNCFICKVVAGTNENPEHILYETENFFVLPGLGAFFDGYTMILPKRHCMSFAELNEEEYAEFLQVLSDMRFILESIYHKKVFVFECGSGKGGGGKHSTSIVHAHVHLAPTTMPVLEEVHKSGLYPAAIEPYELIKKYGKYPYMLYIDQDDNWFISSDPETYFPRQHPRQVLADYMKLEKGQYNWRKHPHREKLDIIANEIYGFLRTEFDNLPIWIQEATEKFL